MPKKKVEEEVREVELCEKCGSKLVEENGIKSCPKCDTEINFFGEDDDF
jgi:ribosomal protein L37AE/L43A